MKTEKFEEVGGFEITSISLVEEFVLSEADEGKSDALLGRVEDAFDCLEKAVNEGFRDKAWFEHDSDLDSLREEPRFAELLKRLV